MKFSSLGRLFLALAAATTSASASAVRNSTYYNPVLPGWHSDPSCAQVDGIFYCVASTFISFPGLPIYASRDLLNWKLISHAWNRDSQIPGISWDTTGQQEGMYAATIRHHDGLFYVICEYLGAGREHDTGVVFKSPDAIEWSDPITFEVDFIDPDLFWDDGKAYVATQSVFLQEINLDTGELTQPPISLWNGTGGVWPEGPHLYKKDGWYYLMIAEGGTERDHSVTIARSRKLKGPYEAYEKNPILTNRDTDEYFQTVGHADLFQDTEGNWWGVALATRSGPEFEVYPMGRETVLFPVTWEENSWPILEPVRGKMTGWPLPPLNRDHLPGDGPFNSDDDVYDFRKGTPIPRNLVHWRVPRDGAFTTTNKGLQIVPSRNNLTGTPFSKDTPELSGQQGLAFIGRRQTDSLFSFSVDLDFNPKAVGQEAGVTVFLTQVNHIDLGVVLLDHEEGKCNKKKNKKTQLSLRFRAEGQTEKLPESNIVPVPSDWAGKKIRLEIETVNATHYSLAASPVNKPHSKLVVGTASAEVVSGGNGSFVGSLVGAYATCNGAGSGVACPKGGDAYFNRWRYTGKGQYVSATELITDS
ncbi:glycoside hydrolase family 43 protein [Poronia punctata]|nr:glycoside hydrolase family 43 protein [Poronia punctata]